MSNHFVGHFDGSSVPNPGKMTIGGRIINVPSGKVVCTYSEEVGEGTNNQAEYLSLIELLKKAIENNITKIYIKGDSMLVVKQVNGEWKVKSPQMKILRNEAQKLLENFDMWKLDHVYRCYNKEADRLTRKH